MSINLIAACGVNRELGYDNKLLCHLPNDLKHFRELTTSHFCVLGRKTFESIGRPLPNRKNIILSQNPNYEAPIGTYLYPSLVDVIHEYKSYNDGKDELFICGGGEIYRQALPFADKIYLTIIEHHFDRVDTYFPPFSFLDWKQTERIKNDPDEKNPYKHYFITYEKRV
jgi:dihydrofolate reductase